MISCLMVTQQGRERHVSNSIRCFAEQTLQNNQLVVTHDGDSRFHNSLLVLAKSYPDQSIRIVRQESASTLEMLRKLGIECAEHEIVCQWNDDDLYHPERLQRQYELMEEQSADFCFMTDQLHLFSESKFMFWDDWSKEPYPSNLIENTVMGSKDMLNECIEATSTGQEGAADALLKRGSSIAALSGLAWLYIYVYHGENTKPENHHKRVSKLRGLKYTALKSNIPVLEKALHGYQLPFDTIKFPHEKGRFYFSSEQDSDGINAVETLVSNGLAFRDNDLDSTKPVVVISQKSYEILWRLSGATSLAEFPEEPIFTRFRCRLSEFFDEKTYAARAVNSDRNKFLRAFDSNAEAITFAELVKIDHLRSLMLEERARSSMGRSRSTLHLIVEECSRCGHKVVKDGCKELLHLVHQGIEAQVLVTQVSGSDWSQSEYDMRLACNCYNQ